MSGAAGAQTEWEHNGSVMILSSSGSSRVFTYLRPRDGLPVAPGTVLFSGRRTGDSYRGMAHIFSSRCGAKSYAVAGAVGFDQRSVTLYGRKPRLDASCRAVGYVDDVLVFNFIDPAVTQTASAPVEYDRSTSTLICLRPVFMEEMNLRQKIDGNRDITIWVAQAINHLQGKYCRETDEALEQDDAVHVGDNCYQYTGMFRGERVFWGACHE